MSTDPDLAQKLITDIEAANRLESGKDISRAINMYLAAWDALPSPKGECELFSSWISDCLVNCYLKTNALENATKWAFQSFASRPSNIETSSLVQLGLVHLKLQKHDEAFKWFDEAFTIGNKRAFKDFPSECIDFYLKRKNELMGS
ncbi:MAG: hypothetical protein P8166_07625 [Candidatus Thiodiazotropha sp.]